MNTKLVEKAINWLLLIITAFYALTGLGITHYQTVEPLTLGMLGKNLAFRIHENLLLPFAALLTLHIAFPRLAHLLGIKGATAPPS